MGEGDAADVVVDQQRDLEWDGAAPLVPLGDLFGRAAGADGRVDAAVDDELRAEVQVVVRRAWRLLRRCHLAATASAAPTAPAIGNDSHHLLRRREEAQGHAVPSTDDGSHRMRVVHASHLWVAPTLFGCSSELLDKAALAPVALVVEQEAQPPGGVRVGFDSRAKVQGGKDDVQAAFVHVLELRSSRMSVEDEKKELDRDALRDDHGCGFDGAIEHAKHVAHGGMVGGGEGRVLDARLPTEMLHLLL